MKQLLAVLKRIDTSLQGAQDTTYDIKYIKDSHVIEIYFKRERTVTEEFGEKTIRYTISDNFLQFDEFQSLNLWSGFSENYTCGISDDQLQFVLDTMIF